MKVTLRYITPDAANLIGECAAICYDGPTTVEANVKRAKKCKTDSHFATMRFAHAVFKIEGISRACANQMVRHKFLDFLQRSQRYCNESDVQFVNPFTHGTEEYLECQIALNHAKKVYRSLMSQGFKKEDCRALLPLATTTELFVVGSLQAWHNFLYGDAGRLQKAAQGEIKRVAQEIERHLVENVPELFGE
jgi:thymidylate synthase (FAD)